MFSVEQLTGKVFHRDCREWLLEVPDETADLIYLDPPFNLQLGKGKVQRWDNKSSTVKGVQDEWDKFHSLQEYDAYVGPILEQSLRVLKPNGSLWVQGTYHCVHRLGSMLQNMDAWFFSEVVWQKRNPMPNFRKARPGLATETIMWFSKNQEGKPTYHGDLMAKWSLEDLGYNHAVNIWRLPICQGASDERLKNEDDGTLHSTQKPECLLERIIEVSSNPGDLVLDPMAGTGTTGAVAHKLSRLWTLCERDAKYVQPIINRINNISPLEIVT